MLFSMERLGVGGVELAYESVGAGEPIVFIHGALAANTFTALLAEPPLASCRRITYRRRGYAPSSPITRGATMSEHAADCAGLLRALEIPRAHIVGHSFGGSVALQLALDVPEVVATLTVLEPGVFLGATAAEYRTALLRNQQRFRELGAEALVDEFFRPRFGADWRTRLDPALFAEAVANAAIFFELELTGVSEWTLEESDLRRIRQPVLAVLGGNSDALWSRFGETHRVLLRALPDVRGFVLPGATHALQIDNPRDLALAIREFVTGHRS